MNRFYEVLKQLREENNLSRKQLATMLNVSERLICYWEAGSRECSFDMLIKISKFFAVSIDFLLGVSEY